MAKILQKANTNDGFCWRRGWESNPRIKVLQTSPLPLGYRALLQQSPSRLRGQVKPNLERETGVEPATSTLARSRSTTELLPLVVDSSIIISSFKFPRKLA